MCQIKIDNNFSTLTSIWKINKQLYYSYFIKEIVTITKLRQLHCTLLCSCIYHFFMLLAIILSPLYHFFVLNLFMHFLLYPLIIWWTINQKNSFIFLLAPVYYHTFLPQCHPFLYTFNLHLFSLCNARFSQVYGPTPLCILFEYAFGF